MRYLIIFFIFIPSVALSATYVNNSNCSANPMGSDENLLVSSGRAVLASTQSCVTSTYVDGLSRSLITGEGDEGKTYIYWTSCSQYRLWVECSPGSVGAYSRTYTVSPEPVTCSNQSLDSGECAIDLGGLCNNQSCPAEPPTCTNNEYDLETEEGTDCGGSCLAFCVSKCADGDELIVVVTPGGGGDRCVKTVAPDSLGNCPQLFKLVSGMCEWEYEPAAVCPTCPEPSAESVGTPSIYIEFPGDTSSSSSSSSSTSTVTNPDNSTTTTTTGSSSSTTPTASNSTTTTITVVKDAAGNVVSESEETEETGSTSLRTGNYDWSSPVLDSSGAVEATGRFTERFVTFKGRLESASIYAPLRSIFSPSMDNRSPVYTINAGTYGNFDINLSDYGNSWSIMKYALIFLSMFIAARIIIVNK